MELIMTISVAVIAAIMVVAVIAIIPLLLQLRRTARRAEEMLEMVRMQIVPVSHDMTLISQEVSGILQSLHRQTGKLEESVAAVRDGAERLREFEEDVFRKIEEPIMNVANLVGAATQGVQTFLRVLLR